MGENNEEVQKEKRPSGDPPIEATGASQPAKAADSIQEWFSTLPVEERSNALGFDDDTMLSVLLKHASLASSISSHIETIPESRTDKNGSNGSIRPFDWHGNVSITDFEKTLEETSSNMEDMTVNTGDVIESAIEESKAEKVEPQSASNRTSETTEQSIMVGDDNTKEESEAIELSDAFRIRDNIKESSPISKESGEGAVEASSNPIPCAATSEIETKIAEIMNNICVIFSSTKELNVSDVTKHAYITLQPSYLRARNGVDVLATLEEILSHALPTHSFFATPPESSWKSLRNSVFSNKETASIPLYAVFVLRIKSAIFDSYRQPTIADTTTGTFSSPTESNKETSDTIPSSATETNDYTANAEKEGSSPPALLSPISVVRLSGISETEEARLLEPSGSTYAAGNLKSLSKEGHCMIFPFHSLLRAIKSSLSQNSDLSTNDAIAQAVQKFIQEASEDSAKKDSSQEATPLIKPNTTNPSDPSKISSEQDAAKASSEPTKANEQQPQRQTGGRKRKKRKQKKKKGNNSQGQNGGTITQAPATQQQPQQGVVSESKREEPPVQKKEDTSADGHKSVEGKNETDKPRDMGKYESVSTSLPAVDDTKTTSDKTDVAVVPDTLVAKHNKKVAADDDKKTESTEQPKGEIRKQQPTQEANNSKNLSQRIITPLTTVGNIENDDSGEWETVEVKGRGNRKKTVDRANQNRFQSQQHGQSHGGQNGTGSKKSKTRNSNRKQRANMRKMVRDILSNVLDRVDEDVQKRRLVRREASHTTVNKWGTGKTAVRGKGATSGNTLTQPTNQSKDMSMRDIIIGRQGDSAPKGCISPVQGCANRLRQRDSRSGQGQIRRGADGFMYREKKTAAEASVDQNTAPTNSETLSAVSVETSTRNVPTKGVEAAQGDSSSGDSGAGSKPQSSPTGKVVTPPLPTLLSSENANSASSSVSSSLDPTHAAHQSNHVTSQQGKEKDVGYHLLDVCDRLTRDINIFMKRREHALEARRRERGAVLMALQGTLSSIWPNSCNVEMYGSCATQLDLPSSDLDVVVTGLYKPAEKASQSGSMAGNSRSHNYVETKPDNMPSGSISDDNLAKDSSKDRKAAQHSSHPHAGYGQLSQNAERIVRLAVELERQPWAAHVKAIPTASVPVIKILADPTRISGNGEWLMQAPSAAEATAVGNNGRGVMEQSKENSNTQTSMPRFQSQQSLPWRGADVMNGLLKVDITFEGPEHGGIGSTKFSSRVVKEFCDETGLLQDGTPAVQALMVLKELLAQRRLNEPFSGGLSSYALLLLVISVLRERAMIREELERVERQRQLVALDDADQSIGIPSNQTAPSTEKTLANRRVPKVAQPAAHKTKSKPSWNVAPRGEASSFATNKNIRAQPSGKKTSATAPAKAAPSSWASIAMNSKSQSSTPKANQDGPQKSEKKANGQQGAKTVRKSSSFADAVANGRRTAKQQSGKAAPQQQARKGEVQRGQKSRTAPQKRATPEAAQKSVTQSATQSNASSAPFRQAGSTALGVQGAQLQADDAAFDEGRSLFPQGFHDVTEVLCSGETTAGKLLMHFLLFYGQHFDSQSTAIDYSGTHKREMNGNNGYSQGSPYLRRRSGGSYDPMTGMFTVDPIVVYDPLEGAEINNVARSCFAWSSIRWVFAQSYLTLLSTVEINQNHANGQGGNARGISRNEGESGSTSQNENELSHPWNGPYGHDKSGNMMIDASSPLLELLLSF